MRSKGKNGVSCKFCSFYSEERSPTALKFHIKRFHDTGVGGLWHRLNELYNWQAPHKYSSRIRKSKTPENENALNSSLFKLSVSYLKYF